MVTQQQLLAVLLAGIVVLSGCAGWGADGPADEGDGEPNQTDDLEDEDANATANESNESSGSNVSDASDENDATETETNTDADSSSDMTTDATDNTSDTSASTDEPDETDTTAAAQSTGGDGDESTDETGETGDGDSQTQEPAQDDESDKSDSSDGVSDDSDTTDEDDRETDSPDESDTSDQESDTSDDSDSADDGDSSADDGDSDTDDGTDTDTNTDSSDDSDDSDSDSSDGATDGDTTDDSDSDNNSDTTDEPTTYTLTVTVTDPDGEPIEGATVDLATYNEGEHVASGTTDENGEVTFEVEPRDYEVLVDTEPLEYTDYGTHPVEVDGDTEYTVQLTSPPSDGTDTDSDSTDSDGDDSDGDSSDDDSDSGDGTTDDDSDSDRDNNSDTNDEPTTHTLTVTVTDPDGEPIEGATVDLTTYDEGEHVTSGTTDANGEVTFDVTPRDYEVLVDTEPLEYTDDGTHPVEVDGDTEYTVQLTSPPDDGDDTEEDTATGIVRVVDQNGEPVEDEQVLLRPPGTVDDDAREERFTDENGEVVIELLAGEPDDVVPYDVEVRGEEKRLPIQSDEHVGVQEVEFEVSENEMHEFERTVRVVDQNGDPVEGESVEALPLGGEEWTDVGTTDENGKVVLTAQSSDPTDAQLYNVRVAGITVPGVAVDNTDQDPKVIELDDGEENEEFVTVRVESETGAPVEGEPVTVIYEDGSESERETNANGEYEISLGITDGSDDVVPITVEVREQSETVLVHDGETHEVVFTVEPEVTDAPVDEPTDNETAASGASTNESTANATS